MEDNLPPRKFTRHHLMMAFLGLTILAVGVTTVFTSSSSSAQKPTTPKASFKLTTNNSSVNPDITLDCEKPKLTLAVMIDRSGSVSGVSTNPAEYKKSVNKFVEDLSSILISRDGELDVLLWGFGSRSIIQNDKTTSNEIITKVNSSTSLTAMKTAVNNIFFSTYADGSNDLSMNGNTTAYAIARGYNAGYPTSGVYTMTNWDDALVQVENLATTTGYNNPAPGKHIDLALMLTDGAPNVHNGTNRVFEAGDLTGYSDAAGRVYASKTVTDLRNGNGQPKMAVRGILINASADTAMNEVFGPANWSKAEDFEADLAKVLDQIINSIDTNVACQYVYVQPKISVSAPSSLTVEEGQNGTQVVNFNVKNTSTMTDRKGVSIPCDSRCNLTDVSFTYNGQTYLIPGTLSFGGSGLNGTFSITVQLGESIPGNQITFDTQAQLKTDSMIRLDPSMTDNIAKMPKSINITIERLPLPA